MAGRDCVTTLAMSPGLPETFLELVNSIKAVHFSRKKLLFTTFPAPFRSGMKFRYTFGTVVSEPFALTKVNCYKIDFIINLPFLIGKMSFQPSGVLSTHTILRHATTAMVQ